MGSGGTRIFTGAVEGTGAAINIDTPGFSPRRVDLFNVDGNCHAMWQDTMPAAAMQKVVDSGVGTTDVSYVTSNGITQRDEGFTIGADADLNASAETIHFTAHE